MFAVVLVAVCAAIAGTVPVTIQTNPADVTLTQKDGFTVVTLASTQSGIAQVTTTEPGSPLLPVFIGNVLIPAGAEIEGVELGRVERVELGFGFNLYPVQPMRPLSRFNEVPLVGPNPAVYASDAAYPTAAPAAIPAGTKAGFRIAGFEFCPFEYYPASGRLVLITRAELSVRYRDNAVSAPVLTVSQREMAASDVAHIVVNSGAVASMAPPALEKDAEEIDVMIVTSSALVPAMESFRKYVARKGYYVTVMPTETIYARYTGPDNQAKIRNMLKEKFTQNGLQCVILAGDVQHVPCRTGYLPYSPYNVPADWYYADLDGTWNANNNSNYGEMTGDSVDLYSDIIVARLPFDSAGNVANFLRKDSTYELLPDTAYLNNTILPFEWLWQNIDFAGRIVNKNIALALGRMGMWEVDSGLSMLPATVVAALNAGRHLFHFAGHGAVSSYGSTFSTSNLASLTNIGKPFITNSMACDCGNFDQQECLGEQFINVSNGGAVSSATNARYGWGAPPTMGPSENLCMEFYNNYCKGMPQGQAYNLAKDFYRNAAFTQLTYRWSVYDWTFQGDPTMRMWRSVPRTLAVVAPDTVGTGPQMLEVTIDCGDEPVKNARVALTHMGEMMGRGVTNSQGWASFPITAPDDTWTMVLSVHAQDARLYEKTVYAGGSCPGALVTLSHVEVADGNGRFDPNEEADVHFVAKNLGAAPATGVTGTLQSLSPYVTVLESAANYGDIASQDTSQGSAYRVRISRDCPHGHGAEFVLEFTAAEGTWRVPTTCVVGLPKARGGLTAVHDTADFCLTVCANGGIGTTTWRGEGFGFIYPKVRQWSSSALMHGSFMLATDTTWVADNYYGTPWQVTPLDFAMLESLRPVYPVELGAQEYMCEFDDSNHPNPKNLSVTQRSYVSAALAHKDFVVLEYRIHNYGAEPVMGLYTGVACDFRTMGWNANDGTDYAGTDSTRLLAYVKSHASGETLALGVRPVYPTGMSGFANCINHTTYISDGFTKSEKARFMDGTLRSTTGTTAANWHALASNGPFAIPAGDSQIVAYVICGARTVTQMAAVSDTASEWYDPPVAVEEAPRVAALVRGFDIVPRISGHGFVISYNLARLEPVTVVALDVVGREVDRMTFVPQTLSGSVSWRPRTVDRGVYFLRVGDQARKVVTTD
jgi:predicted 3-demethylubiquinone-9 3-methyltransferase (glyoxalase superfamily)